MFNEAEINDDPGMLKQSGGYDSSGYSGRTEAEPMDDVRPEPKYNNWQKGRRTVKRSASII